MHDERNAQSGQTSLDEAALGGPDERSDMVAIAASIRLSEGDVLEVADLFQQAYDALEATVWRLSPLDPREPVAADDPVSLDDIGAVAMLVDDVHVQLEQMSDRHRELKKLLPRMIAARREQSSSESA